MKDNCQTLVLGCGIGLEMGGILFVMSRTTITAIGLLEEMLCAFKKKIFDKNLKRIADSYFGVTSLSHGASTNVAILTQALSRNMWVASMG